MNTVANIKARLARFEPHTVKERDKRETRGGREGYSMLAASLLAENATMKTEPAPNMIIQVNSCVFDIC